MKTAEHDAIEYVPHQETIITRLERIGFRSVVPAESDGTQMMTLDGVDVSVWRERASDTLHGCVHYPGEEPCDAYWAAREITDPPPRKVHSA